MAINKEFNKIGVEQLNPDLNILVSMGIIFCRVEETNIKEFSGNYFTSQYDIDGCGIELKEGVKLLLYIDTPNTADSVSINFNGAYNVKTLKPIKLGETEESSNVGIGRLHGLHFLIYMNNIWTFISTGGSGISTTTASNAIGGIIYKATQIDKDRVKSDSLSQYNQCVQFVTPTTLDSNLINTTDMDTIIGPLSIPVSEMPLGKYSISMRVKVNNQLGGDIKLFQFDIVCKYTNDTENILSRSYLYKSDFSWINDYDVFGIDFDLRGKKSEIDCIEFRLYPCYSANGEATEVSIDYYEVFKTFSSMISLSHS